MTPNKSSGSEQSSQLPSEEYSEESCEDEEESSEEAGDVTPENTGPTFQSPKKLTPPKKYSCQFCSQGFRSKASMGMHIRFECGPLPRAEVPSTPFHYDEESNSRERYKCEQCNRSYKYAKSLPLHLRFECGREDCPSSIRVPNEEPQPAGIPEDDIQVLEVIEKTIKCSYCDEAFNKRQELDQHLPNCDACQAEVSKLNGTNNVPVEKERFKCTSCGMSYKYWKSLLLHRRYGCENSENEDTSSGSEGEVQN